MRKVELVVLDDRKHPVESFVFAVNKQDNREIQELVAPCYILRVSCSTLLTKS